MNQSVRCGKLLAITLLLAATIAPADDSVPDERHVENDRPRVGLVLGGGGARGVAHIGVLQELERQRIPIDAIVGTSMGAIVGGLYASGKSTAELEELVARMDWGAALSDEPNRSDSSFRRKQDEQRDDAPG